MATAVTLYPTHNLQSLRVWQGLNARCKSAACMVAACMAAWAIAIAVACHPTNAQLVSLRAQHRSALAAGYCLRRSTLAMAVPSHMQHWQGSCTSMLREVTSVTQSSNGVLL